MELVVLNELEFSFGHPTPEAFLKYYAMPTLGQARCMARYLMELLFCHRKFLVFPGNVVAKASLLFAEFILGTNPFAYLTCDDGVVFQCMLALQTHLADPPKSIYIKYSRSKLYEVSLLAETWLQAHQYSILLESLIQSSRHGTRLYHLHPGMVTPPKMVPRWDKQQPLTPTSPADTSYMGMAQDPWSVWCP